MYIDVAMPIVLVYDWFASQPTWGIKIKAKDKVDFWTNYRVDI